MAERTVAGRGLTLGTAGHIDHGKTRLVAALTGAETDRLAEERRRGISIELGFAELAVPGIGSIGVVDVPGHERLVRTMVAGAGGIDLFLLVVAADDGVMPQTVEHLEVLRALGVERGVVALSKIDLVDAETRDLVREEVSRLLPGTPIVTVSARTGAGVETLREAIGAAASAVGGERADPWPARDGLLHVDRSFTIAGAGTVVTGTVAGAGFAAGDDVTILPSGRTARIRAVQVHGADVDAVGGGRRAALNLAATGREEVPRGSVVGAGEHHPGPSYRLDVQLLGGAVADPAALGRVQVHHGTRDAPARVVALGADMAQLRLEAPLVARARDRLVLRSIAPPATLGGAAVIDPDPRRHGPGPEAERLRLLREGGAAEIVEQAVLAGSRLPADPRRWHADVDLAWALPRHPEREWRRAVGELLGSGTIAEERGMLTPPATAAAERPAPTALDGLDLRLLAALAGDGIEPRPPATLAAALGIPRAEAVRRLDLLAAAGRLRRIAADVYYEAGRLERIERLVLELLRRRGSISLAELRDALRTSRKYSQAILEHLDRSGLTVRRGDEHLPRPSARRSSA